MPQGAQFDQPVLQTRVRHHGMNRRVLKSHCIWTARERRNPLRFAGSLMHTRSQERSKGRAPKFGSQRQVTEQISVCNS